MQFLGQLFSEPHLPFRPSFRNLAWGGGGGAKVESQRFGGVT